MKQAGILKFLIQALSFTLIVFIAGCDSDDRAFKAEDVRTTALNSLDQGKTYLLLRGIDDAGAHYSQEGDTIHLLEMYQLASIKMLWKGQQDSAAVYLHKAADLSTSRTSPSTCDVYLALAELYSHPLLKKDYKKAIEYSHRAYRADSLGENRSRLLHDIGIYYAFMNENDSAIVYLDKAVNLTPANSPYYSTFALNYSNLSTADFHKSIKYLDRIEGAHLGKLITKGFLYLNHGQTDSANTYLERAKERYDSAPENYSINTYNSLRMLSNCVSYALTGKVYPGDGTEINDSISARIALDRKIETEIAENNASLEIELLASETRAQRAWIIVLVVILVAAVVSGLIFWRSKSKYIRLHKEFDLLRQKQILIEADENAYENSSSFEIIVKRAEISVSRFRGTGIFDLIQRGEIAYNDSETYLSVKDRAKVRQTLLDCFADFIVDIKMDAGKLSIDDILTSLLSVMHVSNTAIAACLGVSVGAVRSRKTRLKGKLSDEMAKFIFG